MDRRPLKRRQLLTAHREYLSQAERIARKFGGVAALYRCLNSHGFGISRSAVYKWLYPVDANGRGGIVPHAQLRKIVSAAKLEGIFLSAEDLDPRPQLVTLPRYDRERAQQEGDDGMRSRAVLSTEKNEVLPDHDAAPVLETLAEKLVREKREKEAEAFRRDLFANLAAGGMDGA